MDMHARTQYLHQVQADYRVAKKTERSQLLTEAVRRTGLNRKYLIRKLATHISTVKQRRRRRAVAYDEEVVQALVQVWRIFDHPCGQRLEPLLSEQVESLRALGELTCSDTVAQKLRAMGAATIDRKLRSEKVKHRLRHKRGAHDGLLAQRIPVKLSSEWDRDQPGNIQLDYVEHCGSSVLGKHLNTLSAADIASGWWEGAALMGRTKQATLEALKSIRYRLPFPLREIHPDNDTGLVNYVVWNYCEQEQIAFSRSRPHRKNDNAWVEQRNWTHVRKIVGYVRFDTLAEWAVLNDLYRTLSLYRNYFLPTMKLISKQRFGARVKRKYDRPQTPYQRLLMSDRVDAVTKDRLTATYRSLNPADLKRRLQRQRAALTHLYQQKQHSSEVNLLKHIAPRLVSSDMMQQASSRLPT